MFTRRPPVARVLLPALILFAFALFLHDLTYQDIWWDEARNIDVALRPLQQIATAPELDIHPPLYFWLLHGWLRLAQIDMGSRPEMIAFVARLLSVFGGVLAVVLLYPLGRRLHSTTAALLATAIAATSPFWLAESQETRMYTLSFALLTIAAWYLLRIVRQSTHPRTISSSSAPLTVDKPHLAIDYLDYVAFTLFSTAALYVHYNAIFILVTWYAWWGLHMILSPDMNRPLWRRLLPPFICGATMILLFLPVVPIALRQIPTYANPNLTIPTIGDYLWQNWHGYLGGYALNSTRLGGYGTLWLGLILSIVVVGLLLSKVQEVFRIKPLPRLAGNRSPKGRELSCYQRCRNSSPLGGGWVGAIYFQKLSRFYLAFVGGNLRENAYVALYSPLTLLPSWLVGGLVLYYIAVLDRGAFNIRYSSFVTPPLYLIMGMALANWRRLRPPLIGVGLLLLLIGIVPAIRADLYDPRYAREDVGDLADWLRQEAGPDDLIFVDQKYPFGFYYGRYTMDANATPSGTEAAPARYLFVDVNTLDTVLTAWAGNAQRVFWVQWFESDTDPRHAVRFLLDIVGRRAGERRFQGYEVDWWELTPPTTFQLPTAWVERSIRFVDTVQTVELAYAEQVDAGAKLPVAIRWQRVPDGAIDQPLKARVALYDAAGNRLAQADERLLNDRHRLPAEWEGVEEPLNLYLLELPGDLPIGSYDLKILVYDADTLEALSYLDDAGNPAGIEEQLGTVQVR